MGDEMADEMAGKPWSRSRSSDLQRWARWGPSIWSRETRGERRETANGIGGPTFAPSELRRTSLEARPTVGLETGYSRSSSRFCQEFRRSLCERFLRAMVRRSQLWADSRRRVHSRSRRAITGPGGRRRREPHPGSAAPETCPTRQRSAPCALQRRPAGSRSRRAV